MVDPTSGSPPRPFRSKVIEELTRRHDLSNDLTPSVCFQVLQSLLPSSLVVTMCAEMNRFIYKSPHDDDNNYTSNTASNPKTLSEGAQVPYKDLYLGLLAHVEDKEQLCAGLRRQLREKRHQNNTLAGEIAKYQGLVDEHFAAFNEQACLNAIETLKHRRVLRERQCTGLMKAIDEKQDRLIEQEKRIKEELHRLRMDDCAYRLNAKKFKENQQMLASMQVQQRPEWTMPSESELKSQIKLLQADIAVKHPKLHDLSTQIFAVRFTRAGLESQLRDVESKTEAIQARVAAYQMSHTPRPNWEEVRKEVESTFRCHNMAGEANVSTTELMKLQSSGNRVEYLATAIELIGLSQDTDAIDREKRVLHHLHVQIRKIAGLIATRRQSITASSQMLVKLSAHNSVGEATSPRSVSPAKLSKAL